MSKPKKQWQVCWVNPEMPKALDGSDYVMRKDPCRTKIGATIKCIVFSILGMGRCFWVEEYRHE